MTDFELDYMFMERVAMGSATMMNYITLVFAMVTASYLVAHQLNRTMMITVLTLFSAFAMWITVISMNATIDMAAAAAVIADRASEEGSSLAWHAAAKPLAKATVPFAPIVGVILHLGAYMGTIWFFFQARNKKLQFG